MKAAFARVFSKDSNGLPKTWRADSDVAAQCRRGHVEALRVLGLLAVSGVRARATWGDDPDGSGVRDDAFISRFETTRALVDDALASFLPVGTGADADGTGADAAGADAEGADLSGETYSSASTFPSEWPGVDDDRVLLDPGACRAAWRKFEDETAYAVSQALAAKEAAARGGHPRRAVLDVRRARRDWIRRGDVALAEPRDAPVPRRARRVPPRHVQKHGRRDGDEDGIRPGNHVPRHEGGSHRRRHIQEAP